MFPINRLQIQSCVSVQLPVAIYYAGVQAKRMKLRGSREMKLSKDVCSDDAKVGPSSDFFFLDFFFFFFKSSLLPSRCRDTERHDPSGRQTAILSKPQD